MSEARVNSFSWGSRQKLTESRLISKDQISSHLRSKTPLLILLETVEENSDEKKEAKNSKHRAENNRCLFRVVVLFFEPPLEVGDMDGINGVGMLVHAMFFIIF